MKKIICLILMWFNKWKTSIRFIMWFEKKSFYRNMKSSIGYTSLDTLYKDIIQLEQEIKTVNDIPFDQKITWNNSKKTDREKFALYTTLRHFHQKGEALEFIEKEGIRLIETKQ